MIKENEMQVQPIHRVETYLEKLNSKHQEEQNERNVANLQKFEQLQDDRDFLDGLKFERTYNNVAQRQAEWLDTNLDIRV